jgi:hypothetical protein
LNRCTDWIGQLASIGSECQTVSDTKVFQRLRLMDFNTIDDKINKQKCCNINVILINNIN